MKHSIPQINYSAVQKLHDKAKEIRDCIKGMKESQYSVKSEYHRLMYSYHLELETLNKSIALLTA